MREATANILMLLVLLGVVIFWAYNKPATAPSQQAPVQVQRWNVCWGDSGSPDAGTLGYTFCAVVAPTDPSKGFTFHNPSTGCRIEISPSDGAGDP